MKYELAEIGRMEDRYENFCQRIIAREGLAMAYKMAIDATVSDDIAKERAYELVRGNIYVRQRINELQDDLMVYQSISKENMLVSLKRMVDVSVSDFYKDDGSLKPMNEWTRAMKMACVGIKPTRFGMEIKIQDKLGAITNISRMMGYDADNGIINIKNGMEDLSIDELKQLANTEYADFIDESADE